MRTGILPVRAREKPVARESRESRESRKCPCARACPCTHGQIPVRTGILPVRAREKPLITGITEMPVRTGISVQHGNHGHASDLWDHFTVILPSPCEILPVRTGISVQHGNHGHCTGLHGQIPVRTGTILPVRARANSRAARAFARAAREKPVARESRESRACPCARAFSVIPVIPVHRQACLQEPRSDGLLK